MRRTAGQVLGRAAGVDRRAHHALRGGHHCRVEPGPDVLLQRPHRVGGCDLCEAATTSARSAQRVSASSSSPCPAGTGASIGRVTSPDPSALLDLARTAAVRAGALLVARAGTVQVVETKSSETDPVSAADRAAEELLVQLLLEARPDDGLLGEEGADRPAASGLRWVLDPLDGTVNYLYGLGGWAVSVACERRVGGVSDGWEAVAGVVHDPLRGETFAAAAGAGAVLHGTDGTRPLRVNDPVPLSSALVATGFAYRSETRERQAAVVARLLPRVRDIRRIGSAALDLCAVASGRVDGYYEDSTNRWDWAAGALVAAEAGALVGHLPGPHGDGGLLAAGPALAGPLRDLVSSY